MPVEFFSESKISKEQFYAAVEKGLRIVKVSKQHCNCLTLWFACISDCVHKAEVSDLYRCSPVSINMSLPTQERVDCTIT